MRSQLKERYENLPCEMLGKDRILVETCQTGSGRKKIINIKVDTHFLMQNVWQSKKWVELEALRQCLSICDLCKWLVKYRSSKLVEPVCDLFCSGSNRW